jgi:xylulokinase
MAEPRVSAEGEGCLFASPDDLHYMALICFLNGSLAREAVRDRYDLDWSGFSHALRATRPGNGGGLLLPYFAPEIVPKVAAAGPVRRRLDEADARANVRAVVEAQALSSRIHARWMGVDITSLSVTGGASANAEILRIYANVHGCPVHRFNTTSSAALGAALRALQGHSPGVPWADVVAPFTRPAAGSTIAPDPAAHAVYDALVPEYEAFESAHVGRR